jgi:two-component system sensor histidine kinase CiaH
MFQQARLRLTLLYSIIFLLLFWSLSSGIYLWMNRYFGFNGKYNHMHINYERSIVPERGRSAYPPSDIVMDELRDVLILLDVSLLFIVPLVTWFLTGKTLAPVQKSYEREKQFLTDVSHDLRTPLTILNGDIEVTLQKDRKKEEYIKTLQSNKEEVNDLIGLVENMLFLSREETQYKALQKEQVDLTDILTERIAIFQKAAVQKKVLIQFNFPQQSVVINGNAQLLKRLFTNLLDNAIKYTPAKGKISVTLNQKSDASVVKISDSGIGISQEHQEKIFERFFRVDTSRSQKGYGLGLSIAKQIVEFHHAAIHLTSKIGKGTTITLSFPYIKQTQGKSQS